MFGSGKKGSKGSPAQDQAQQLRELRREVVAHARARSQSQGGGVHSDSDDGNDDLVCQDLEDDEEPSHAKRGRSVRFEGRGRDRPSLSPPRLFKAQGGGSEGMAPGVEFWHCARCTVANENILVVCLVCSAPKPPDADVGVSSRGSRLSGGHGRGAAARSAPPKFVCGVCTYVNADANADQCEMCGTKRVAAGAAAAVGGGGGGGRDGESKEDDEARGNVFVMGQESPPAFKREPLVREHLAFMAGIEEAFGTIHVSPQLLQGVERLVRRPFETLLNQYGGHKAVAQAPSSSSSSSSPHRRPSHAAAAVVPASAAPITPDILNTLLKALVYRACATAMRVRANLDLILACCLEEEEELRSLSCNACQASGSQTLLHYSENCGRSGARHAFCLGCTHRFVTDLVISKQCAQIRCPFQPKQPDGTPVGPPCLVEVDEKFVRRCLNAREYTAYLDECFSLMIAEAGGGGGGGPGGPGGIGGPAGDAAAYLRCPNGKCGSIMEVARPHGLVVPAVIREVDDAGKPLSAEAWLHFSEFRVRCHACQENFCSACKTVPYHSGRNCQQHQGYMAAAHCRFCSEQLTEENTDKRNEVQAFNNVCTGEECQARKAVACTHVLGCGHPCPGIRDEEEHVSCLMEECAALDPSLRVCSTDLCSICWTEELGMAPVVKLTSCGHIFHAHCVTDKLSKRWPGVRITFGFVDCSICKVPMDHPSELVQRVKAPIDELYRAVSAKALARLQIEKMEKDPKLITEGSQFFGKPMAYAMASFAFYNCFKCKKFYFGGRRDCEQNAAAEVRPPEEFICYDCADLKSIKCKKADHSEYQVWKCRFCCNLATFFCFGTTHYCDPCHQDNPMEKVRRKRSGFKQCPGYQMCPCRVEHSPNGPEPECEFCVGCGACQEELFKLQAARDKEKLVDKIIDRIKGKAGPAGPSASVAL